MFRTFLTCSQNSSLISQQNIEWDLQQGAYLWIQSLRVIFLVTEHLLYRFWPKHLCSGKGYLPHLFPTVKKYHIFLHGLFLNIALWEFHGWPKCPLTLYLPPGEFPYLYIPVILHSCRLFNAMTTEDFVLQ